MEDLPAEVLHRVAAFLPLKEAVRTSFLSTSWRDLWRPCTIDDVNLNSDQHFMQVIGKYLKPRDVHELLRLSYKEVDILAARGVERELYLDFSNDERETQAYALKLNSDIAMRKSTMDASFASLKNLNLKSVSSTFVELSSVLFANCVLLERLKVEQCRGLEALDVAGSGCLEEVVVVDCPDLAEISIASSGLKSFTYRGRLPGIKMKESYGQLVDVTVDLVEGLGQHEFDVEEVLSLFASLRNVETLNITGWLLEWLCSAGVIFQQLEVHLSSVKQLRISQPCINKTKLDSLSCFLDICPSLQNLHIHIDRETKDVACPYFYHYWHEPYFGSDSSILMPNNPPTLQQLRMVEVSGFQMEEYELWLLHLLLKRALLLSFVVVQFGDGVRREVTKFPLSHATRNKHMLMMTLVSPNQDYYLGFTQI
ncbi:F-box protein At5g03100-like [Salvia miltiorrhiza]|uniref:F-box protein At5g03100-like n=1 Tax=Salvia miltiorrhiza TaxID=226208 RepID=UPI0025AD8302|nr:F-box protein At5g03100-like [Salvia miltiorrhiza]